MYLLIFYLFLSTCKNWVSSCCLMQRGQFFSYVMARTRWRWYPLGTRLNTLNFIVLVHWNNSPRVHTSFQLDTLSWFRNVWLLVNAKWVIFQPYHGDNKLHFDEMMLLSTLYLTNMLSLIFIVLVHWNYSPQVRHVDSATLY